MKSLSCFRLERALREGDPPSDRLAHHARLCPRCAPLLAAFARIDEAAPSLRKSWDSPGLLDRALEAAERKPASSRTADVVERRPVSAWVPALYAAALVLISTLGLWVFRDVPSRNPFSGPRVESPFLGEDALLDVERKEEAYVASIDRLSSLAREKTPESPSALVASYRERLLVIDSAIAECRSQIDQNRYNAHLRKQLLAMYDEKKRTLEDLLREVSS